MIHTCMNSFKQPFVRYLGLFGDHIVPAVLYRYTQVLRREDLVNTKEKPLVTVASTASSDCGARRSSNTISEPGCSKFV